jgi:hypothetical protein
MPKGGCRTPTQNHAARAVVASACPYNSSIINGLWVSRQKLASRQYCSLNDPDPLCKIHTAGALAFAWTQRVVTHLSLHAARVDPVAAGNDPLFKNFIEDRFV